MENKLRVTVTINLPYTGDNLRTSVYDATLLYD